MGADTVRHVTAVRGLIGHMVVFHRAAGAEVVRMAVGHCHAEIARSMLSAARAVEVVELEPAPSSAHLSSAHP